ncbi:MAG TPA: phosphoribosylglycinamide synthetase C domain-containing protein, partial [bacterium]|nr:phosphoribosylglycinamide synthetase C domain-containing protein [bacterium]
IEGLERAAGVRDAFLFHAGTALKDGRVVTAGGRVLCVTGIGKTLKEALQKAYEAAGQLRFEGAHYRRDIGWRALARK